MAHRSGYKIAATILGIVVAIETLILIGLWQGRARKPFKPPMVSGKIAIVLDDWGYNTHNFNALKGLRYPVTISVLPGLAYSRVIADEARSAGLEVILHLPMEPHEKYNLEKNTIRATMGETEIVSILKLAEASLGGVHGVSNHMGSKATEDSRTMAIIFRELKKKGMYYLDSVVSAQSVCKIIAQEVGLRFTRRDVFIDNQSDADYIRSQMFRLKTKARIYGRAVGIGHDRPATMAALAEIMPQLEKEGFKFVFVSDLVR